MSKNSLRQIDEGTEESERNKEKSEGSKKKRNTSKRKIKRTYVDYSRQHNPHAARTADQWMVTVEQAAVATFSATL